MLDWIKDGVRNCGWFYIFGEFGSWDEGYDMINVVGMIEYLQET